MANPADFTGTPFVAGSIYGERCFNSWGDILKSPTQSFNWVDGENVSTCLSKDRQFSRVIERLEASKHFGNRICSITIGYDSGQERRFLRDDPAVTHGVFPDPKSRDLDWVTRYSGRRRIFGYPTEDPILVNIEWVHEEIVQSFSLPYPFMDWGSVSVDDDKPTVDITKEIKTVPILRETGKGNTVLDYPKFIDLIDNISQHQFLGCSCGFYAYYNGYNEYLDSNAIVGIIEGYGETVIGTRGFRSQKARIVALAPVVPLEKMEEEKEMLDKLLHILEYKDMGVSTGVVVATGGRRMGKSAIDRMHAEVVASAAENLWKSLQKRYPNVAFFRDADTMRSEFPVTDHCSE